MTGALLRGVRSGGFRGASTITMQLSSMLDRHLLPIARRGAVERAGPEFDQVQVGVVHHPHPMGGRVGAGVQHFQHLLTPAAGWQHTLLAPAIEQRADAVAVPGQQPRHHTGTPARRHTRIRNSRGCG